MDTYLLKLMSTIEPKEFTHAMVHRQVIPRQNPGTEWNILSPSSFPVKKKKYSVNFELLIMTEKYYKKMSTLISINNLDLMHVRLNKYKVKNVHAGFIIFKKNHDRNNLFYNTSSLQCDGFIAFYVSLYPLI